MGFLTVAGLGLVSFGLLAVLMPSVPAQGAIRFADLPVLIGRHTGVRIGVVLTILIVVGHFCAYTFVRPLLTDVAGFDANLTGVLFLVFGVAGVAGNFLASAGHDIRRTLLAITGAMTLALCGFALFAGASPATIATLLL